MPVHGSKDIYPPYPKEHPLFQFRTKRYAEDYELISDMETFGDWTLIVGDSIAVDTDHFREGSQGIRWRSINGVSTDAERTINLNCIGKHFSVWIYVDNIENLSTIQFRFRSGGAPWNNYYWLTVQPTPLRQGWSKIAIAKARLGTNGGPDWAAIDAVMLRVISEAGTTVNVTFDDFRLVRSRFAGKVTLRFDDAIDTHYTEARARMDEYGFRGVSTVPIDRVGTAGFMTLAQLEHLQERGWDIVSHSVTHPHLPAITPAAVEAELWNSQRWLIENEFYRGSRFFVVPHHDWNTAVGEQIKKYYLGCHFAQSITVTGTIPPGDPQVLWCSTVNGTAVATVTGWIDEVIAHQGWLTLHFHDIAPGGTPVANFQDIIDYIEASGLEVVTFSDVFDELIGSTLGVKTQLLEFGVQGVITPNATSYPCPGGAVAAQTATEIKIPVSRGGFLKNLRVRQRVASGAGGRTDIYTVRVNGVDTGLTCTLDNVTVGSDLVNSAHVDEGDEVSVSLVSNNVGDVSADVSVTVELELLM